MIWTAPEILRMAKEQKSHGTPKGDVYSFAIICQEMLTRSGPFDMSYYHTEPKGNTDDFFTTVPLTHSLRSVRYRADAVVKTLINDETQANGHVQVRCLLMRAAALKVEKDVLFYVRVAVHGLANAPFVSRSKRRYTANFLLLTDLCIRRATGVGPWVSFFFGHFTVFLLSLS